jgi:ABC-type sugar transport system substrate-binding protein
MRTRRLRAAWLLPLAMVSAILSVGGAAGTLAQSPGDVKIGFSLPALDEYYSVVAENASNYAASKGYTLFQGNGVSGGDPTVQIAKVQNLLAQGINVLLISPQSEALTPVLDQAVAQGVKVIFIDQQIPGWGKEEGFIGTDNPKGSALMGNYLAERLGGKGKVGILVGSPGIPVSLARTTELQKILEAAGIQVILSSQQDLCQLDVAVGVFQNFLTANPDVDAMYTICGPDGLAVDKVLADQPSAKKIISTTWDVPVVYIQHILDGTADAAIAQFPVNLAQMGVDAAITVATGGTIPAVTDTGTELVTKDNAASYFHEGDSGYAYKLVTPSASTAPSARFLGARRRRRGTLRRAGPGLGPGSTRATELTLMLHPDDPMRCVTPRDSWTSGPPGSATACPTGARASHDRARTSHA